MLIDGHVELQVQQNSHYLTTVLTTYASVFAAAAAPTPACRQVLLLPCAVCMVGVLVLIACRALVRAWRRSCLTGVPPRQLHSSLPKLQVSYGSLPGTSSHGHIAPSARPGVEVKGGDGNVSSLEAGGVTPALQHSSCSGRVVAGVPVAKLLLLVFISLSVLYPGIMYSALTVFYCVPVALPEGVLQQGSGRVLGQVPMSSLMPAAAMDPGTTGQGAVGLHTVRLWVLDMEQQCYQGYHLKVLLPVAVLVLVVVGLGLPACNAAMAAAAFRRARRAQRPVSLSSVQSPAPQLLEQPPGPSSPCLLRQTSAPSLASGAGSCVGGLQRQLSAGSQVVSRQPSSLVDSVADWYRPGAGSTARSAAAGGLSRQTSGASEVTSRMPSVLFTTGSGATACPSSAPFHGMHGGQATQGCELPCHAGHQPTSQSLWGAAGGGDAVPWYVIVSGCLAGSVQDGMQWWPAASLLMLCALVAAAVFGAPAGPGIQPGFVLLVTGIMIVGVLVCRPYRSPQQTCLVLICLLAMAALLYVAQLLAVCAPTAVLGAAAQLCMLSVPAAVTSVLLLVLLLLPVACTVWSVRKELAAAACGMMTVLRKWATRCWA